MPTNAHRGPDLRLFVGGLGGATTLMLFMFTVVTTTCPLNLVAYGFPHEAARPPSWIVSLKDNATNAEVRRLRSFYGRAGKLAEVKIGEFHAIIGPAAGDTMKGQLRAFPAVAKVEVEQILEAPAPPMSVDNIDEKNRFQAQSTVWDWISRVFKSIFAWFAELYDFFFGPALNPAAHLPDAVANRAGRGVTVFVIDSGLDFAHPIFDWPEGQLHMKWRRARLVNIDPRQNHATYLDATGHGTHVAGTACGLKVGIARAARVVGLRVMDRAGRTTDSHILRALEEVSLQCSGGVRAAVVNLSLGRKDLGSRLSYALARAVVELLKQNVAVVSAAGNMAEDACRDFNLVPGVITVAAMNGENRMSFFSNYGKCVDLVAPGVNVLSAVPGGSLTKKSGTSMSAPVVTGVMAALMGRGLTAKAARDQLLALATAQVANLKPGTPNRGLTPDLIRVALTTIRVRSKSLSNPTKLDRKSRRQRRKLSLS